MISRRRFGLGVAAVAAGACNVVRADAATASTCTAYALPTEWHPFKQLGDWPLDHTCVATSTGLEWGCFGRVYSEDPSVATVIATGSGDDLWAKEIAGADGYAGIDYGVTGVCDQCSNRILLPAGLTVKNSPGNEIATLLCGIYGLRLDRFITNVKDAAATVNREYPGRISEEQVAQAVERVRGGLQDEWDLVRANNERLIRPVLGAKYDLVAPDIECVYLSFYHRRAAFIHAWERGSVDKATLVQKVTLGFLEALNELRDVLGPESYKKIIPVPPQEASDYVFYRERA